MWGFKEKRRVVHFGMCMNKRFHVIARKKEGISSYKYYDDLLSVNNRVLDMLKERWNVRVYDAVLCKDIFTGKKIKEWKMAYGIYKKKR